MDSILVNPIFPGGGLDLQFEETIQRNPFNVKTWIQYVKSKQASSPASRYVIYERALNHLPRSYKIWHLYLTEISTRLQGKVITDPRFVGLISVFERAIVHMHKMPRIWYNVVNIRNIILLVIYFTFVQGYVLGVTYHSSERNRHKESI